MGRELMLAGLARSAISLVISRAVGALLDAAVYLHRRDGTGGPGWRS